MPRPRNTELAAQVAAIVASAPRITGAELRSRLAVGGFPVALRYAHTLLERARPGPAPPRETKGARTRVVLTGRRVRVDEAIAALRARALPNEDDATTLLRLLADPGRVV